jgi:metal-dependent hydrolase (beta-lactamase superfamily II)
MILNWLSKLSSLPRWVLVGGLTATGFAAALVAASSARTEASKAEITVLYDAFGKTSTMKKDWGFSALIEYGDKRILFDTGNNAEIFAHNVATKGIDLTKLDFAIVSHRHGDHTSGLSHLLKVNPTVKIYAPQENFGVCRWELYRACGSCGGSERAPRRMAPQSRFVAANTVKQGRVTIGEAQETLGDGAGF